MQLFHAITFVGYSRQLALPLGLIVREHLENPKRLKFAGMIFLLITLEVIAIRLQTTMHKDMMHAGCAD